METVIVYSQTLFIFLLLCFSSLVSYFLFFKKPKGNFDLLPSPPAFPIIGHFHLLLAARIHMSFQKISSKYGPLLHLRIFNVPVILISSPAIAYEIFRAQDINISSRGVAAIDESLAFGSAGFVHAPYGDYWKFMKKLIVTKVLGPKAMEQSRSVRNEELELFYKTLLDKAMKKESVDFFEEAVRLVNNTLCTMTMGRSCSVENNEAGRVMELVAELATLSKKFLLGKMLRNIFEKLGISPFKKKIMDVSRRFEELLDKIILEHEEKPEDTEGKDFMDLLLADSRDENAEYKITKKHIKSLFTELFLGATDTSSTSTQWVMAEIINNPKIFQRVREEIDSVVGKTRLIQETDLPNLPYLEAVIKEALRLHPSVPFLVREFRDECTIGGFYVPNKTTLVVNVYAMMRDTDFWEDPDEFKPERFLASSRKEEDVKERFFNYIPFGSGRRKCPGSNLGSIFIGTVIGMMVQCFDWEIKGGKVKMEDAPGRLFLTMAHPLRCTPLPRTLNPLPTSH
ncbi:PREDICTED: cytochrome P450 705A5 [Camelina sativa]|uniref:Cytochrome P450 705A5 n=1 Tax=Camelina sativa TaxID=90675 RepID=A0ABM0Y2V5_CAMSA|nr:PREDICTED: cytochrome P450 705A5 [Camelina sativa]